ncbi:MAG: hypothetical protein WCB53_02795 [Terriglobales bacterium]
MKSLNKIYSRLDMQRRYEAWFLRFGLADGSGAWWLRYLLMNPGRGGCSRIPGAAPAQLWATWFPRDGHPETFIQEFPLKAVTIAGARSLPKERSDGTLSTFSLKIGSNSIDEDGCRGAIEARGKKISWDLMYRSHFGTTLSDKKWIGFSRTPHSDAVVSGSIRFGDRAFRGEPLGFGVQGHNCGVRHRKFWTWMHACFPAPDRSMSTLETLVYEMPLGLTFRKAVLWHEGRAYPFKSLREHVRDSAGLRWEFAGSAAVGSIDVEVSGPSPALHRLNYAKTDCSGMFEVSNNSLAKARVRARLVNVPPVELATDNGAVLEMAGEY